MNINFLSNIKISTIFVKYAVIVLVLFSGLSIINAQATLSVQGILKKASGIALEDGEYPITFKIYVVDSTQVKWMETQPEVEVISGIYSVILGVVTPLSLPFDKDYELGISIGSQEMRPRVKLTSAPYALALRGSTNQFPSSGQVLADRVKVAQGVIVNNGAPLVNNTDGSRGYSFNNDNDSGLFSTQGGKVSIFTNGVERFRANTTGTATIGNDTIQGTLGTNNINLFNNGGINYNSSQGNFQGWRLADVDPIGSTSAQGIDADANGGWKEYNKLSGEFMGWNNSTGSQPACLCPFGTFIGNVMVPTNNEHVLKKKFKIAGDFSEIKVKFKYYVIDSWGVNDYGFAGFAVQESGSTFRVGWLESMPTSEVANNRFSTNTFESATQFAGSATVTDLSRDVEMTARRSNIAPTDEFWVFIGSATNGAYAVGPVEIWVR
jgi:hypothetical protein